MNKHYVYIVRCSDGSYYTGWTVDIKKRINKHNDGKGAKYTKSRLPVKLVYYEEFLSKSEALKREIAIKLLNHRQKDKLVYRFMG